MSIFGESVTAAAVRNPVWSEEFDAGSVLDERVWSYDLGDGGWGNGEFQRYSRDEANLRIEDRQLVITAHRERGMFTSARIKTEGKLAFKYGTLEARVQMPDLGNGLWPALWALGSSFSRVGWPRCGEIIVMEMGVGGAVEDDKANRRVMSAAHWEENRRHQTHGLTLDHPYDLHGSFHTYRMEWTPAEIRTYIDDARVWTLDISDIPQFHEPHFLLLNLAVGGDQTGVHDPADVTAPFPAEYRVDYIRVYDNGFTVMNHSAPQDAVRE